MKYELKMGLAAAFAALALLAVLGWTRKPDPAPAGSANTYSVPASYSVPVSTAAQPYVPAPGSFAQYDGTYVPPSYMTTYSVRTVRPREVVTRAPVNYEPSRVKRNKRSTKTSVAIVAGSAGVGAAIGAIAGGGKGAGIGALAGGAGGFVYDRLTHNKR